MFVVYSKDDCGYCKRAKDLLDFLGEDFEEMNVSVDPEYRTEMFARLADQGTEGPYTYPQIWSECEYIGGFTELNAKFS